MGLKFNPFSGNFDFTGGGGDAAPFAGQVDAYADLPLDSTAALNSRWLVKNNSGTWPFSTYKQAGIYIRVSTVGASRDTDYQFVGTLPSVMNDNEFLIYDDADATKNLKFQLSGITTGTTRTLTVPDASGTLALTSDFAAPPAIGNTTPAAISGTTGTFSTLTANNGTLTASAPVLDLSQTWNAGGTTFTGLKITATDTASAAASVIADFSLGSTSVFAVTKNGLRLRNGVGGTIDTFLETNPGGAGGDLIIRSSSGGNTFRFVAFSNNCYCDNSATGSWIFRNPGETFRITNAGAIQLNADQVTLIPDAANILAQRRTTNAQTFNIYNTFTSATNHERGFLKWSSNVFQIGTEAGSGGGTARDFQIVLNGSSRMTFAGNGANIDVGATFRPSVGNSFTIGGNTRRFTSIFLNTAVFFGDTTSASDPALIKSGTTLQVRLANDSAFAPLACGALTLNGNLDASTRDLVTDTTTGTKIGTATSQKIGFFNATPVVQQAAVADATDAASTQDRLNDLLARLRTLGLIAT